MFDYMGALSCLQRLCPCGQRRHQHVLKSKLARQRTAPKLSGSELRLQNLELTPAARAGTFWHAPELLRPSKISSGTCLQNQDQHTSQPSGTGTFRKPPPEPTQARAKTLGNQNLTERSGTNLPQPTPARPGTHQYLPKPFGTFWNLPPEPTTAPVGTFRNLPPEPAPATRAGARLSLPGLKPPLAYAVGGQF